MSNLQTSSARSGKPSRRFSPAKALIALAAAGALLFFFLSVHPFLAINRPVRADTLVVEGWVPDYVTAKAAGEFLSGHYRKVFVSGLVFEKNDPQYARSGSDAGLTRQILVGNGVDASLVEICPLPLPGFNRTSHMARAVREKMQALNYVPQGVNVVTLGPHARQTLLAYQRMLGGLSPVGVISYPKNNYDPARWWASAAGFNKTIKDFAGWLKEVIFGLRS